MLLMVPLLGGLLLGGLQAWPPAVLRAVRVTGLLSLVGLLFLMGARTGADPAVRVALGLTGLRAAAVALGATGASVVAGRWYARRFLEDRA